MTIQEKDFILTPINDSTPKFDLELLYKVQAKGKDPRMEFKTVAFGISLEYAIRKIAQYRVTIKHEDEAISIQTYFNEFKDELDSIKNLCKITDND